MLGAILLIFVMLCLSAFFIYIGLDDHNIVAILLGVALLGGTLALLGA